MSKEVVLKHPCMTMCCATNGIVIRTRYEKGEEPKGGGGGGEGRREGLREQSAQALVIWLFQRHIIGFLLSPRSRSL